MTAGDNQESSPVEDPLSHGLQLHEAIRLLDLDSRKRRILIVGDVMLDKYIHGSVTRISPEAPVPVGQAFHRSRQPGGAANVAANVAGLGAEATVIGFTGDDDDSRELAELLNAGGVMAHLICVPGTPTTSKLRILGGSQQIVRLDIETDATRPPTAYSALMESARALIPEVDAVILSDYAKGVLTAEVCQTLIAEARLAGLPVLVDPKGRDFRRYRGATTICPNLKELALATGVNDGIAEGTVDEVLTRGEAMIDDLDLDYLTVTMGEKGIAVLRAQGRFLAPAVARQVFDVSGAGDTVTATLALAAASGIAIEQAARIANIAAGIVVSKVGTVPITRDELLAAVAEAAGVETPAKIMNLPVLMSQVAEWRALGHTIVFTNGCFDVLHVGHISLLETCRQLGGKVVAGVNSDASVTRLKGPGRPVVGVGDRARMMAALAATDAVVVFEGATPIDLITALRPDVLVKGGDYTEESIVGAAEVRSWGGRVAIVPTLQNRSTTEMIRRLAGRA